MIRTRTVPSVIAKGLAVGSLPDHEDNLARVMTYVRIHIYVVRTSLVSEGNDCGETMIKSVGKINVTSRLQLPLWIMKPIQFLMIGTD